MLTFLFAGLTQAYEVNVGSMVQIKNYHTWTYIDMNRDSTTGLWKLYSSSGDPDSTRYWTVNPIVGQNYTYNKFQCNVNVTLMNSVFGAYLGVSDGFLVSQRSARVTKKNRKVSHWMVQCANPSKTTWTSDDYFQLKNLHHNCYLATSIKDTSQAGEPFHFPLYCQKDVSPSTFWKVQEGFYKQA